MIMNVSETVMSNEVPTRTETLRSGEHRLPQHSLILSCQTEETEAETHGSDTTYGSSLQLVHLRYYTDDRFAFFSFQPPSSQHPPPRDLLHSPTSVPAPTLKEEEHFKQNCSNKSHQRHSSHEHRGYRSYSCNSFKLKIREMLIWGFFCLKTETLRPTVIWRFNIENSGEIK